MATSHTAADDIVFDLISVQYHALKGAEVHDRYIQDAHGHEDVVAFFTQVKEEDDRRAEKAHELLKQLTQEKGGIS